MQSVSKNELVKKISICGQIAEHKSEKSQELGLDEENILAALSMSERDKLTELLDKLQKKWLEDHKEHHGKD